MKETNINPNPPSTLAAGSATWIVHTPSGPVLACELHAVKIAALMSFLGIYTNRTAAPEGAQCSNCLNEMRQNYLLTGNLFLLS